MRSKPEAAITLLTALFLMSGCTVSAPDTRPWTIETPSAADSLVRDLPSACMLPTPRPEGSPYTAPTPDSPHALPALRTEEVTYTVQAGDYLALIAARYNLPLAALINANTLINPNLLEPGMTLTIPAPQPVAAISDFKIIPDSGTHLRSSQRTLY